MFSATGRSGSGISFKSGSSGARNMGWTLGFLKFWVKWPGPVISLKQDTPWKPTWHWKHLPFVNRIHISTHSWWIFQPVILVFRGSTSSHRANWKVSGPQKETKTMKRSSSLPTIRCAMLVSVRVDLRISIFLRKNPHESSLPMGFRWFQVRKMGNKNGQTIQFEGTEMYIWMLTFFKGWVVVW